MVPGVILTELSLTASPDAARTNTHIIVTGEEGFVGAGCYLTFDAQRLDLVATETTDCDRLFGATLKIIPTIILHILNTLHY